MSQPSSTPPGYYRPRIPEGVLWGWITSLLMTLVGWAFSWHSMHEDVRVLQEQVGMLKATADRAFGLAASCESRLDVAERKIERLERDQ